MRMFKIHMSVTARVGVPHDQEEPRNKIHSIGTAYQYISIDVADIINIVRLDNYRRHFAISLTRRNQGVFVYEYQKLKAGNDVQLP